MLSLHNQSIGSDEFSRITVAAEAWVTLATNDSYAVGALVLAHSLKSVNTTRPLVVMITDQVSSAMRYNTAQFKKIICGYSFS